MKVSLNQAQTILETMLKANIVPYLKGSPGIGKSAIAKAVANKYKLKYIDFRLAECDPVDLSGFPKIEGDKATYIPMSTFPLKNDPIPEGYKGWLLMLDELSSAPPAVQAAAYKLILDRAVGMHPLHDNCYIVAAGNLATDNAVVMPMSSALVSRMAQLEVEINTQEWLDLADKDNIHTYIKSFIQFKPDALYTFNNANPENAYACPRTWYMTNEVLKHVSTDDALFREYIGSLIGEGLAYEFSSFIELFGKIPSYEDIIATPTKVEIPKDLATQWAMIGTLVDNLKEEDFSKAFLFIERISVEHQVVALKRIMKRYPNLIDSKEISKWTSDNVNVLL